MLKLFQRGWILTENWVFTWISELYLLSKAVSPWQFCWSRLCSFVFQVSLLVVALSVLLLLVDRSLPLTAPNSTFLHDFCRHKHTALPFIIRAHLSRRYVHCCWQKHCLVFFKYWMLWKREMLVLTAEYWIGQINGRGLYTVVPHPQISTVQDVSGIFIYFSHSDLPVSLRTLVGIWWYCPVDASPSPNQPSTAGGGTQTGMMWFAGRWPDSDGQPAQAPPFSCLHSDFGGS